MEPILEFRRLMKVKIWVALKSNGEPLLHSASRTKGRPLEKVAKISGCSVEDLKRRGISVAKGEISFAPEAPKLPEASAPK